MRRRHQVGQAVGQAADLAVQQRRRAAAQQFAGAAQKGPQPDASGRRREVRAPAPARANGADGRRLEQGLLET